ncbi:MAG TPA: sigma-70 family RNA polymerase sigma factor [bacterium]|nr:sigma-70 family RNA polymerase sigma factor [bacterium]
MPTRTEPDPCSQAETDDLVAALQGSIAALPQELRSPLALHLQDEWTLQAIGSALALSAPTVRERVRHALQRLRAALQQRGFAVAASTLPRLLREPPPAAVPCAHRRRRFLRPRTSPGRGCAAPASNASSAVAECRGLEDRDEEAPAERPAALASQ